jgi:hypothetical protein
METRWPLTATHTEIVDEIYASARAVLMGKRMFDVGVEPLGDPPPFGMPVFVVTHESHDPLPRQGSTTYHFITGGLEAALADARAAAEDEDVGIRGVWLAGHPPSCCPTAVAGRARPARDDGRVRMVYARSMPSLPLACHPPNDECGEGASSNRSGTIC